MDNMTNIISSHNKKITNSYNETNGKTCNWRNKSNCPLDNKYLTDKVVYIVYLIDSDIKWSIFKKSSRYSIVSKSCNLCILEKLVICNFRQKDKLLNKRLDLVAKGRYENNYILMNYSELFILMNYSDSL